MKKKSMLRTEFIKECKGVIWLEESINGTWDVFFDLWGEHAPIGDIAVKEEDLKLIPKTNAKVNEKIKSLFDK